MTKQACIPFDFLMKYKSLRRVQTVEMRVTLLEHKNYLWNDYSLFENKPGDLPFATGIENLHYIYRSVIVGTVVFF